MAASTNRRTAPAAVGLAAAASALLSTPPRHVHHQADEIFFLLDGHLEVSCGDDAWQASPGSLIFLPRGIPHQFTAASDGPARTLLINAPAGFGEVIVELGEPAPDLSLPAPDAPLPSPDRMAAVQERYGIAPAGDAG